MAEEEKALRFVCKEFRAFYKARKNIDALRKNCKNKPRHKQTIWTNFKEEWGSPFNSSCKHNSRENPADCYHTQEWDLDFNLDVGFSARSFTKAMNTFIKDYHQYYLDLTTSEPHSESLLRQNKTHRFRDKYDIHADLSLKFNPLEIVEHLKELGLTDLMLVECSDCYGGDSDKQINIAKVANAFNDIANKLMVEDVKKGTYHGEKILEEIRIESFNHRWQNHYYGMTVGNILTNKHIRD